jgi:toxin ParE1/3/4
MSGRNSYTLEFTSAAQRDLQAISAHSADTWGAKQALAYSASLYQKRQEILINPFLGRAYTGLSSSIRGRKSGTHLVFHRVQGEAIYSMRILHQSMNHGRHIASDV